MRRFFTLIELLVVVAIISILMTILLPALSNAKFMAKRSQCTGQLKQIALGLSNYIEDHDEWFPRDGNSAWGQDMKGSPLDWQKLGLVYINKYLTPKEVFECPGRSYDNLSAYWRNRYCGYSYLMPGMSNNGNYNSLRLKEFIGKKHFVSGTNVKLKGNIACFLINPSNGGTAIQYLAHKNRGVNYLRFDSSVAWLINPGIWGGPYWSPSGDCGNQNDFHLFWKKANDEL